VCFTLIVCSPTAQAALSGNWISNAKSVDEKNGVYEIYTPEQLAWVASTVNNGRGQAFAGKTVKLMADIDLAGKKWTPIGAPSMNTPASQAMNATFVGTFDGNYKVIRNLSIGTDGNPDQYGKKQIISQSNGTVNSRSGYVGLFGTCGGWGAAAPKTVIKNVGLENVSIHTVAGATGALVGNSWGAYIENCYSTGVIKIYTSEATAGGLVGDMAAWNIVSLRNCYSTVTLTNTKGDTDESFAGLGGLVGSMDNANKPVIVNCYAIGNTNTAGLHGGLLGRGSYSSVNGGLSSAYHNSDVNKYAIGSWFGTPGPDEVKLYARTTSELKTQSTYVGWDFNGIWALDNQKNNGYPYLRGFNAAANSSPAAGKSVTARQGENAKTAKRFDDKAFLELCETGTLREVENAIKAGADVNAKNKDGWTALMYAAGNNSNPEVISTLRKNGADANARDQEEQTALMHAAGNNSNSEVISTLLKAGVEVNAKNKYGATALMHAADNNGNSEVILTLLEMGADPELEIELDGKKFKALDFAQDNDALKNTDALQALEAATKANRLSDNDFLELCKTGTLQQVENAIKAGANVNAIDEEGKPALISAALNNIPEAITALMKAGADVNKKNEEGITALMHVAPRTNNPEVITILIQNGADVNARDLFGKTALMWTAQFNSNPEIIITLLQNGADAQIKDQFGKRAVDFAKDNNNLGKNNYAFKELEKASGKKWYWPF